MGEIASLSSSALKNSAAGTGTGRVGAGNPGHRAAVSRPVGVEVSDVLGSDDSAGAEPDVPEVTSTEAAPRLKGWARFEAWIEQQAHRRPWVQRLCSRIWLPVAFHSGIAMKKLDRNTFSYVLPFKRFNRNWYNAMAGAALVGNSEVAAGMYLFGELGGEWTIVCKQIQYRFLRPCFGPAVYKVVSSEDLKEKIASGREFNIDLVMEILQQVDGRDDKVKGRKRRVGACDVTFHCTPKDQTGNRRMLLRRLKEAGDQEPAQ